MIIERNIAPYVVFAEDPILTALQKISANGQRIIFLVNESGILRGSLSDGDFRRWLIANPTASLETSALDAANTNPQTAPADADPETLRAYFAKGINHVPLTDERGHLVALAMDEQDVLRIGKHTISEDSRPSSSPRLATTTRVALISLRNWWTWPLSPVPTP